MALESGTYVPKNAVKVSHWPRPDKNGDGEEVWEDEYDSAQNFLGKNIKTDQNGETLRFYAPPEGFKNYPSFDHTDNYVAVDERGRVRRQPNGEAICIKPGRSVVEQPDGSVKYLDDDYQRSLFAKAHDKSGE